MAPGKKHKAKSGTAPEVVPKGPAGKQAKKAALAAASRKGGSTSREGRGGGAADRPVHARSQPAASGQEGYLDVVLLTLAIVAIFLSIFIGSLYSGHAAHFGLFRWIDQYQGSRGRVFMGEFPILHQDAAPGYKFNQIPDLINKVVIVTGAGSGAGLWTAYRLAEEGAVTVLACRNMGLCNRAASEIKEKVMVHKRFKDTPWDPQVFSMGLDLGSFKSIREFAYRAQRFGYIDSIVLNEEVMVSDFEKTKEGLEMHFGANHVGHHLLVQEMMPLLDAGVKFSGKATIVVVSSSAHHNSYSGGILPTLDDINDETKYIPHKAYAQSKLANLLFAQELAKRVKDKKILVNSVNVGAVNTTFSQYICEQLFAAPHCTRFYSSDTKKMDHAWSPRVAALTPIFAAMSKEIRDNDVTGKHFNPIAREAEPDAYALDTGLQKRLWEMTDDFIRTQTEPTFLAK